MTAPMQIPTRLTRPLLRPAFRTALLSFVTSMGSSPFVLTAWVAALVLVGVVWWTLGWAAAAVTVAVYVVMVGFLTPISMWVSLWSATRPRRGQGVGRRVVWVNSDASLVVIAKRKTFEGGPCYAMTGFAAWPRNKNRSRPFRLQLYRKAVSEGMSVTATSINSTLFRKLYEPDGFVVVKPHWWRLRPKMVRYPWVPVPVR
jgi:hypothetical protein